MRIARGPKAALVLSLLAGTPPAAALGRRLPLDQVVEQGKTIVVGTVVCSSTRWGEGRKMIWTDYEVAVEEAWKGSPETSVTLSFAGGTLDGRSIAVSHVPRLAVGTTYVFSLNDLARLYTSPVVGADQGLFREATEQATGKRILLDADGWAVGLGAGGELVRVASAEPADVPGAVILRRDAPRLPAAAGVKTRPRGIPGATYSDGSGRPLAAPSGRPTLAASALSGAATGGVPLTRDALRAAVRRVLEPLEPAVR